MQILVSDHALERYRDRLGKSICSKQHVIDSLLMAVEVDPTEVERERMRGGERFFYSEDENIRFIVNRGKYGDQFVVVTCYPPEERYQRLRRQRRDSYKHSF